MTDLNLNRVAQTPVPTPRPTLVPEERVVSGVRTIYLKSTASERQTIYLHFNKNELFKVVYEDNLGSIDGGDFTSTKYKYLPKEKRLIREEWDKNKCCESFDMERDSKNEFVIMLGIALKQIENSGQRDAFLETSLKNVRKELKAMEIE